MLTQIQYNKLYILYNVTSYIQYNNNKYILFWAAYLQRKRANFSVIIKMLRLWIIDFK